MGILTKYAKSNQIKIFINELYKWDCNSYISSQVLYGLEAELLLRSLSTLYRAYFSSLEGEIVATTTTWGRKVFSLVLFFLSRFVIPQQRNL